MDDYQKQKEHNEELFRKGAQMVRPDIFHLMEVLDTTHIDYTILVQVLYFLEKIATGTRYGEVRLFIENGVVTFVKGDESKKLNIPIIKSDPSFS